jgi:hypothetical protein
MTASRSIYLPKDRLQKNPPEWALILFDGDAQTTRASFSLNGKRINSEIKPLYLLDSTVNLLLQYQIASCVISKKVDDIRQWRVVEIPLSMLIPGEINTITIQPAPGSPSTIYGVTPPPFHAALKEPSLRHFSPTRLYYNPCECEPRTPREFRSRVLEAKCALVVNTNRRTLYARDLSTSPGRQFGQYRMYLVLGSPIFQTNKSPKTIVKSASQTIKLGSLCLTPSLPYRSRLAIPKNVCDMNSVNIRLTGFSQASKASKLSCQIIVRDKGVIGSDPYLPGTPTFIPANPAQSEFKVEGSMPSAFMLRPQKEIEVSFASENSNVRLDNVQLELSSMKSADITKHRLEIY